MPRWRNQDGHCFVGCGSVKSRLMSAPRPVWFDKVLNQRSHGWRCCRECHKTPAIHALGRGFRLRIGLSALLICPNAPSSTPGPARHRRQSTRAGGECTYQDARWRALHGLYSPAASGKPSVLFFLGNADRVGSYGFFARALAARGIGLLALSYRGYPGSTGTPSEDGLLTDGIAAFDWLLMRSKDGIVVMGQSLGSGVAVNTAAQRPASGVILVSAYLSVLSIAETRYPYFPIALLIKDPFRSDRKIADVRQPKLFIHGRRDNSIPLSSGEALYHAAPEPKQMLIDDDSGHNDLWDNRMIDHIIRFVEALK